MSEQTFPLSDFNDLESTPEAAGETSGAEDDSRGRRQQARLDAFHVHLWHRDRGQGEGHRTQGRFLNSRSRREVSEGRYRPLRAEARRSH